VNLDPNTFIKPLASSWVGDALTTAVGYGLNQSIDAYEQKRRDDMERIRQQAEKYNSQQYNLPQPKVFVVRQSQDHTYPKNVSRVQWIKEYRSLSGLSLKEVKDISDGVWNNTLGDYVLPAATVYENRKSMAIGGSVISTAPVASDMAKSQETLIRTVIESMVKEAVALAISEISVANTDKYKAAVEMMAMLFDQGHDEAAKLLCKSMTKEAK
jgi:hypothetical protein